MKRYMSFVVVAVLLGVLVSLIPTADVARAVEPVEQDRPKLTIWLLSFLPQGDTWHEKTAYEFGVKRNVDVEVIALPEETMIKKVQAGTETGDLPDLFMGLEFMLPSLLKANRALDISDVLADLNKQGGGLVDAIIPAMTYDGKQWAIPHQVWADAIYVRKDLLEAKGLTPPTTYAEAAEVAKALNDPTVPVYGYGMHLGACADATAEISSLIWSFGGSVWAEDGTTVALKSPETTAAMQWLKDLWDARA
jgi:multiple sugar transport system substrate-binding protein